MACTLRVPMPLESVCAGGLAGLSRRKSPFAAFQCAQTMSERERERQLGSRLGLWRAYTRYPEPGDEPQRSADSPAPTHAAAAAHTALSALMLLNDAAPSPSAYYYGLVVRGDYSCLAPKCGRGFWIAESYTLLLLFCAWKLYQAIIFNSGGFIIFKSMSAQYLFGNLSTANS